MIDCGMNGGKDAGVSGLPDRPDEPDPNNPPQHRDTTADRVLYDRPYLEEL